MTVLFDIFGFLSVLLRGLQLAFEAVTVGGVIFLAAIAGNPGEAVAARLKRWLTLAAALLVVTQIASVAVNSAILMGSTDLRLRDLAGANFWISGMLVVAGAAAVAALVHTRWARLACPLACTMILAGSVMGSHAMARLEHRDLLAALTLLHHIAGAAWIGGLPYLLVTLRHTSDRGVAETAVRRFSALAITSVAALAGAGALLAWAYTGSVAAITGTTYGIMLLSKVVLTALLLALGALNFRIVRAVREGHAPVLLPLRRFTEAEVGIGLTVLLVAAALTSTPPAVDLRGDRVTGHEIAQRMTPRWPRMATPRAAELSPATPLAARWGSSSPVSFVPGQAPGLRSSPADIAWSEYNHHWAGMVVVAIGLLAFLARYVKWARHWPLVFFGLALFLLIRADAENWPLGPHGFWESFQVAEVAQHRLFVLLIVAFGIFEWAVQNHRLAPERAGLIFPLVCAVGGALLMTHSHSLGNVKEEFLAELSHIPLALLAVAAGWARWLEVRLPWEQTRLPARVWPVCFVFIGAVLMLYRES